MWHKYKTKILIFMADNKTNVTDFPINRVNPFMEQAIEVVQKNVVKKYKNATNTGEKAILQAVDPNSGEVLGVTSFVRQVEVDEEQFVKIYLTNFKSFFDLSTSAIRVFGYLIQNLVAGKDLVLFGLEAAKNYTKYTAKSTIYIGLTELLQAGIIARGWSESVYFINPMCLFNGNRLTYVKTYVKKKKKQAQEDPNQLSFMNQLESDPLKGPEPESYEGPDRI